VRLKILRHEIVVSEKNSKREGPPPLTAGGRRDVGTIGGCPKSAIELPVKPINYEKTRGKEKNKTSNTPEGGRSDYASTPENRG